MAAACEKDSRNRAAASMANPFQPVPNLCRTAPGLSWYLCRPSSGSAAKVDNLWVRIREEALSEAKKEPVLAKYFCSSVLSHSSLEAALAKLLSQRLSCPDLCAETLFDVIHAAFDEDEDVKQAIRADLRAAKERDPACLSYTHCLLNFKGFHALQSHRAAHSLWGSGRKSLAVTLQSRASEVFAVDIHPAARIGRGVVIDHATGVVVGETAVVGNNVTLLHGVTLGGTGKVAGDRHPKIGDGVLVGAGSKVLGNVRVGDGAKIGAGSVVLRDVTAGSTVVGNPAKPVERKC